MRRVVAWVAGALAAAVVALLLFIRLAPDDPTRWHVDPLALTVTSPANSFLAAPEGTTQAAPDLPGPILDADAATVAAAFDRIVLEEPRTRRLAGAPEELWTTYVQRSLLMGYPDYISVRAVEIEDDRTALAVYSRSRYGRGDWGVNEARVRAWLEKLDQALD